MSETSPLLLPLPSVLPFLAPENCTVVDSKFESDDTVTLTLQVPLNYSSWRPGQFNMLYMFGMGEVPLSISGPLSDPKYLVHTVKAVGPLTRAITKLTQGDTVWIRGPFGCPWPNAPEGGDLLLVAGGIGLAPLRPLMFKFLATNARGRIYLLYGARTPSDVLFTADLTAWAKQPNVTVQITVDHLDANVRTSQWSGSVGVVTHLMQHLKLNPRNTTVMTCGPEIMMRHLAADLGSRGISDQHIFVSLERNMKCAVGLCGRCQWGPTFVCRDGPVFRLADIRRFWTIKEF